MKFFLLVSLIFLDLGVLFGGLNSLRLAGVFNVIEIHNTHWFSTLFGAMTLLMLAQIYFMLAQLNDTAHKWHKYTLLMLGIFLLSLTSGYLSVWATEIDIKFALYFVMGLKLASLIYLVLVIGLITQPTFRENAKNHPSVYLIISALIWFAISMLVFFRRGVYFNIGFRTSYIYGFFTLTIFGTLSFVLPILYNQKKRSLGTIKRDLFLFNSAAIMITVDEILGDKSTFVLDLFGPIIWGLGGLMFIFWVFDLMYKTGISTSLVGLQTALFMFGFFVFDTFMKNVFPMWIQTAHVHFMFLGTLVLTIVSIGTRVIIEEYNPKTQTTADNKETQRSLVGDNELLRKVGLAMTVMCVLGILFSFTFEWYTLAGIFGFILFVSLILVEISMIFRLRS